jgi:WD40 repeat protein
MWSSRLTVAGLVIASAVVLCAFRETYWIPTTNYRVLDSGSSNAGFRAAFSPQRGVEVLTSHGDGICLWNVRGGIVMSAMKRNWSCDLTWQAEHQPVFVQVSNQGRVQKWGMFPNELLANTMIDAFQVKPPRRYQGNPLINPYRIALSRDGRLAAVLVTDENRIALVNFESRRIEVATLGDLPPLSDLALSHDGKKMLVGSSEQQALYLCDCRTGKPRLAQTYAGVFPPRGHLLFSPDDQRACVFGARLDAGSLRIVDLEQKGIVLEFPIVSEIVSAAFATDGRRLLTAEKGNILRLLDAMTGQELQCYRQYQSWIIRTVFERGLLRVDAVAVSPDGTRGLASSSDGTVSLWRLPSP